jgi:hypothetical protein
MTPRVPTRQRPYCLEDAALLRGRATGKVFVEGEPVSLAIVYPFYAGDIDRVVGACTG